MINLCAAFLLTLGPNITMVTKKDVQSLERAAKVCKKRYKSCLKRFEVKKGNHYNATCR